MKISILFFVFYLKFTLQTEYNISKVCSTSPQGCTTKTRFQKEMFLTNPYVEINSVCTSFQVNFNLSVKQMKQFYECTSFPKKKYKIYFKLSKSVLLDNSFEALQIFNLVSNTFDLEALIFRNLKGFDVNLDRPKTNLFFLKTSSFSK